MLKLAEYLKGKTSVIYDGIGGDVLSAGLFLNEERLNLYKSEQYEQLALNLFKRENSINLRLNKQFYKKVSLNIAIAHLTEELKKHKDAPNPVGSFYFWNRTRREIVLAPYRMFGNIETVYSPFLDHDVYDLLSSLDANMFLDHNFHTETIIKAYPQYKSIPYEDKNADQRDPKKIRKKFVKDSLMYMVMNCSKTVKFIRFAYVFPRLLYSLFTGASWWICPKLLYLIELEKIPNKRKN